MKILASNQRVGQNQSVHATITENNISPKPALLLNTTSIYGATGWKMKVSHLPTMSLFGPTSPEFQLNEYLDGQLQKPSWCLLTNTTYLYEKMIIKMSTNPR